MRKLSISKRITDRSDQTIGTYFKDVSRLGEITREREIELSNIIKNGNQEEALSARNELVTSNLRFAITVAKHYHKDGDSLQNIIQEANMGLIKAAEKFNPDLNIKFISYAVWWIRQSIIQYLSEYSRVIRLPSNKQLEISEINKASEKLSRKLNREPNDVEIFMEINEPVTKMSGLKIIKNKQKPHRSTLKSVSSIGHAMIDSAIIPSIHAPMPSFNDLSQGDMTDIIENENIQGPDDGLKLEDNRKIALSILSSIKDDRKKRILELYYGINDEYGDGMTYDQIADQPGMTIGKERIKQLREEAERELCLMYKNI